MANIRIISVNFVMLSQVVINQGNFALQNRAENVVQTVVHCFSIMSGNKLIINKIIPLSQSPLGSHKNKAKRRQKRDKSYNINVL